MKVSGGTSFLRTLGLAFLLVLCVLATTACFRFELSLVFNEDGSGVMGYTMAISEDLTDLMTSMGGEESDIQNDFSLIDTEDLPPGAESKEYNEDGFAGVVVTVPFADLDELRSNLDEQPGELGEDSPFDQFDISQDDDGGWRFSMLISPQQDEASDEASTEGTDFLPGNLKGLESLLADGWFRVRVKLPGELAEHNADRVENGELVWEMGLDSAEARQLEARTAKGGLPVAAIWAIALGAVFTIGAIATVVVLTRRRA